MSFEVVAFKAEHYVKISKGIFAWFKNNGWDPLRVGRAYEESGPAYTGFAEGQPVVCAGVVIPWPGFGEAWALLRPEAKTYALALNRRVLRGLYRIIRDHRLRRVQASVAANFEAGMQWAEWLGFRLEGSMPLMGPNGETFLRYAMFPKDVKGKLWPTSESEKSL